MKYHRIMNLPFRGSRRFCLNTVIVVCCLQLLLIFVFYSGLSIQSAQNRKNRDSEGQLQKSALKSSNGHSAVMNNQSLKKFERQDGDVKFLGDSSDHKDSKDHVRRQQGNEIKYSLHLSDDLKREESFLSKNNSYQSVLQVGSSALQSNPFLQVGWACSGERVTDSFAFHAIKPEFWVYSVFWDQRRNDFDNQHHGAKLRIMTVTTRAIFRSKTEIFCHFREHRVSVVASYYEMCENHGKANGGYILSCDIPSQVLEKLDNLPLCSVHISSDKNSLGKAFKVYTTEPQTTNVSFSVCVSPLFGTVSLPNLVEWLELQSILGVNHVLFYDYMTNAKTRAVLRTYENLGRVTVIPWKIPVENDRLFWYHGQLVAIMDCLYRSMAASRYIIMNDLDEVIIPYQTYDLPSLLEHLGDDRDTCGYQFQSAFFEPSQTSNGEVLPFSFLSSLMTVQHNRRTDKISALRTKCLLKPYQLFEAGIHHISKPILASKISTKVSLPVALLHHYRKCLANYGMKCKDFVEENIVQDKYGTELLKKVERMKALLDI